MVADEKTLRDILARCPPFGSPDVARAIKAYDGLTEFPELADGFYEHLIMTTGLDEEYAEAFHEWMQNEGLVEVGESQVAERGSRIYDGGKLIGYQPSPDDDSMHGETIWVYRLTDLGREFLDYLDRRSQCAE
jgi:hypothetical protein